MEYPTLLALAILAEVLGAKVLLDRRSFRARMARRLQTFVGPR